MIEVGKFTGDIDAATGYIFIQLSDGGLALARPGMAFPLVGVPTKSWLAKYKDRYLAIVSYLDDNPRYPVLLTMIPASGKIPAEGYEDHVFLLSEKFRLWLNDSDNQAIIEAYNSGVIHLGGKDSKESAILGDKMKSFLEKFIDEVAKITVISPVGNTSTPVNVAALQQLKTELASLLSKSVKIKD
jgi:hypothetical protein